VHEKIPPHVCFFSESLVWSDWERSGDLLERLARRVPVCPVCGRQRQPVRPRPPVRREVRAAVPAAPPLTGEAGRTVATALVRRGGPDGTREIGALGLFSSLARRGVPASLAEEHLDHFLRAGWIEGRWLVGRGGNRLETVTLRDPEALQELAHPGVESRRRSALAVARERVASLTHPKAREIAALLAGEEAGAFAPKVVTALAALAVHVESGEPLAERVFSARALGDSKALSAVRGRLERLLGPLTELGIREGGGVTLLGGRGALRLFGADFDLALFTPFVGFSRETLEKAEEIRFPAGGLLVVENFAAFEACCRGEMPGAGDALVAWSAGYPGRAVRKVVAAAGAASVRVRVWADLDLDGVRIARLVASWAPETAAPWRMDRGDLADSPASRPLPPRAAAAILRDLEERPGALLADTLQALLESQRWVEQESFLALPVTDS
jgi:Uncharacterized protein conserved in bacteria C-term(DUF2220)